MKLQEDQRALPATLPDGRPWPKISVITPSYNQGQYIEETIQSVIGQGYPNVEHIIVDGGSRDGTLAVIERYRSRVAHVISEPDRGQSDALNKGFKLATGDIFCWLNSDDQFAPGALAAVAMAFATNDADIVSGICEIYEDGVLVHRHMTACAEGGLPLGELLDLDNGWNAGQFFYQPEVFFTRRLWEEAGAHVREDCYYSMDYELWCRFAMVGAKLHVIGAPLAHFRTHPDQKTADPSKFKKELIRVRDQFVATNGIELVASARRPVDFGRRLRIAMVNDHGFKYGAGIAHGRLAAGMEMAGHDVISIGLSSRLNSDGVPDEGRVVAEVVEFDPDLVVFGNLHSAVRDSVSVIEKLSELYPSFWVTHDFWLFTGRCAYWGSCTKYLTGCDETCPSASSYPDLAPGKINDAWQRKRALLSSSRSLYVLANSSWSFQIAREEFARMGKDADSRVRRIQLGAPTRVFKPIDKAGARAALGIEEGKFVIAFSVSSLGERRKGGHFLIDALSGLDRRDVSVLVIGNLDVPFELSGVEVVALGYVTDNATLTAALNAADVYVGPSTEETFGQVFIEAALAGTPSIGFDLTGVRDAIRAGITGLLVSPSAASLRDAIRSLYDDRSLCEMLGLWARIYSSNEHSIEAAYRTLFVELRKCGLVEKVGVPHKIGFSGNSGGAGDGTQDAIAWCPLGGVSPEEGPYPQFGLPTPFRWCHGERSRIAINCVGDREKLGVRVVYYNSLFDTLPVVFSFNGRFLGEFALARTQGGNEGVVHLDVFAKDGINYLDITPRCINQPSSLESRALTFMLKDIELV